MGSLSRRSCSARVRPIGAIRRSRRRRAASASSASAGDIAVAWVLGCRTDGRLCARGTGLGGEKRRRLLMEGLSLIVEGDALENPYSG